MHIQKKKKKKILKKNSKKKKKKKKKKKLSVSPSGFPHQVRNIRIEKQINIPSEQKLNWEPQF